MATSHFDTAAASWDNDPTKVARAHLVADAVAAAVPLTGRSRVLEYGAGTGLVTQALGDRVGPATLADSSAGMRGVMAQKVTAGLLPGARVWDLDLEHHQPPPQESFDLVLSVLVMHHVRALDRVLGRLTSLLVPGGRLAVVDLDREDGTFHRHRVDVHHGFDRAELTTRLTAAGLGDVSIGDCTTIDRDGASYPVFLALGTAPA